MLRLSRIFKNYNETGSLGEQINLYGFIGPHVFLTKTGEVGVILEVRGVDHECLDARSIDGFTKRLESALKLFDENSRVYQYLFKRNNETVPYQLYSNPIVDNAIKNRIAHLGSKADRLFSLSVYYVALYQGFQASHKLGNTFAELLRNPKKALADLRVHFSPQKQTVILGQHVANAQTVLLQKARNFILQVSDFLGVRMLEKQEAFRVLKKTLNFHPDKLDLAKLKYDTFLDYYLPESSLECHRGHLRVDDYYVKVLTLKEPCAQSFPLVFKRLLEVEANYYVVTEWKKEDSGKMRRIIQSKRRHFHNTKRSFASQVSLNDVPSQDVLLDDSKESQVRELGESLKEIEVHGNYFGQFSLTVVIYDLDLAKVDRACADFYKVFSVHDAQLYEEKYNLLNAFLAAVPGNHVFNLRSLYLLNTNYADFSFLFTLHSGEPRNPHLRQEYLAVLETNHHTPYFLNLHYRDAAHTMILGRTGAGKFFSLSRQPKCIPIIATQSISSLRSALPGESWRTLLQTFRTKIFLSLSDDFSAKTASDLCGREDQLKVSYSLSESGHDTKRQLAHRQSALAQSQHHRLQELQHAERLPLRQQDIHGAAQRPGRDHRPTMASIPLPPMFCYLKPYYNDPNDSYFVQLAQGKL